MIKNIKRVGIIFLAVAIICLMVTGFCLAFGGKKDLPNDTGLDKSENNWQTVVDVPDISEANTVRLNQATDSEMTIAFNEAIQRSRTEGIIIKVVLEKNWNCPRNMSIGDSVQIVLDLNGFKMDASTATNRASIFYNYGTLFVTDSVYRTNANSIKASVNAIYNRYDNGELDDAGVIKELDKINCGKITGGATSDNGYGGIINTTHREYGHDTNGYLPVSGRTYVFGGLFFNSQANRGGAFFVYDDAILHFYDGIIAHNKTVGYNGGGISLAGYLLMKGGIIAGNHSSKSGGGIELYSRGNLRNHSIIEDVIIRSNRSFNGSGGLLINYCSVYLARLNIHNNIAGYDNDYQSEQNNSSGGGALSVGGNSAFYMTDCEIYKNEQNYGGAIYISTYALQAYINNSVIAENTSYRHCGGIYVTSSAMLCIENTTIENNQVVYGQDIGGCGLQAFSNASIYAKNMTIRNNEVLGSTGGGGIYVSETGKFYLSGANDISGNTIKDGVASDLFLANGMKLYITGDLSLKTTEDGGSEKPMIVEENTNNSRFDTFTYGYSKFAKGINPATIFTTINGGKAVLKNGEVAFDYSVNSIYDFVYLENGVRKYYKDSDKLFGYNDNAIGTKVLGKILPNTSVNDFVKNIQPFGFEDIKLFNCEGTQVYGSGADSKFVDLLGNCEELAVGTDWHLTIIANGVEQTIYLSVLGDINGDGKINSADVTLVNKIANGEREFESLSLTQKLATLIINKNKVTSVDREVLWQIACGKVEIQDYI